MAGKSSPASTTPKIGVLDLQGGVVEHIGHFDALGVSARRVKKAADLAGLSGLVIPGGESSCQSLLLHRYGLDQAIEDRVGNGLKLWGTCAGAILLARDVHGGEGCLRLIDISIKRNAFGRQRDSFSLSTNIPEVDPMPVQITFIRAPKIVRLGSGVSPLLQIDDYWAAARDSKILVTVFHPELTPNLAFHRYFARMCGVEYENPATGVTEWRLDAWVGYAPIP